MIQFDSKIKTLAENLLSASVKAYKDCLEIEHYNTIFSQIEKHLKDSRNKPAFIRAVIRVKIEQEQIHPRKVFSDKHFLSYIDQAVLLELNSPDI